MAGLFSAAMVFVLVLFVRAIIVHHEIRSGLFTFAILTAASAWGLWRITRWGRSLALIVTLGNVGIGALAILAAIMMKKGPILGPAILVLSSLVLAGVLGLRVFNMPYE